MGTRILLKLGAGAFVALLVTLASGCGSGSEVTASAPLTKQEFIKQGNAVCDKRLEERDSKILVAYQQNIGEYKRLPKAGQEKLVGKVALEVDLPIYRKLVRQLGALTPPAQDAKTVEQIVSKYEALLDELFEHPENLEDAEPLAPNAEALSYGLISCNL
jgi:hypothetical protein